MGEEVNYYNIQLDRPNGVYMAGEHVTGTLNLVTGTEINCRRVMLRLLGEGFVEWHVGMEERFRGSKNYVYSSMTMTGNFHRTDNINICQDALKMLTLTQTVVGAKW